MVPASKPHATGGVTRRPPRSTTRFAMMPSVISRLGFHNTVSSYAASRSRSRCFRFVVL